MIFTPMGIRMAASSRPIRFRTTTPRPSASTTERASIENASSDPGIPPTSHLPCEMAMNRVPVRNFTSRARNAAPTHARGLPPFGREENAAACPDISFDFQLRRPRSDIVGTEFPQEIAPTFGSLR